MKEYVRKEIKRQPKSCKCDPALWEGWFAVCDQFVADKSFRDGRCKKCDHNKECHEQ